MALLTTNDHDGVHVVTLDDGKANALSFDMMAAIHGTLDEAEAARAPIVITGREGRFSGGFDLNVMRSGNIEDLGRMVNGGAELVLRLFEFPTPVVILLSGHALAAGAFVLLSGDRRLAIEGAYQIGLPETRIGMVLPDWAIILAEARLSRRYYQDAALIARSYGPEAARDAGFVDRVVPVDGALDAAVAEARELGELPADTFAAGKKAVRRDVLTRFRASLQQTFETPG